MEEKSLNYEDSSREDIVDFARENIVDERRVKKWEKAHDTYNAAIVLAIPVVIAVYIFQSFIMQSGNIIEENISEVVTVILAIFIVIAYLARRAKSVTGLTRGELSVHYFGKAIIAYEENNYEEVTQNLLEFEDHARMNTVSIFSDNTKGKISNYVENIEEDSSNKDFLTDSFDEFSTSVRDILVSSEDFEGSFDSSEDQENVGLLNDVLLEGLGTFPLDRYLALQITIISISLVIFYRYSQQLGMFLVVSLLPIAQRLKDRE